MLRFAHTGYWLLVIPVLIIAMLWRSKWYRYPYYRYPLAGYVKANGGAARYSYRSFLSGMRAVALSALALVILQPQLVDPGSHINVEGVDIVLALDVSGSMQLADFDDDTRSRFAIAKDEAMRFIEKREADAIGLVLFGREAVSRCPLTVDKRILRDIVTETQLGVISTDGTVLSTGLMTAINRLKHEKATSKVIIALTDGEPSPFDADPEIVIEAAQKLGIKIYTVGIGSTKQEHIMVPLHGLVLKPKVNEKLLRHIADETGGRFFMASNAHDMRAIYTTIDQLEKSDFDVPLYSRFYDLGSRLAWGVFLLLLLELIVASYIWFGV